MFLLLQLLVLLGYFSNFTLCQTELSTSDKEELLAAHNYFRGIVSPTAANMERMVWNDELATVAQNYADNCVFEHNNDRISQQATFASVGENLAITTAPTVNYTNLVEGWYDEVQAYNFASNQCTDVCGHYTQVVWATSRELGCGAYRCADIQGLDLSNGLNLVCNYGPAGNLIGQRPYVSGDSCTQCPQNQAFCVSNLCSETNNVVTTVTLATPAETSTSGNETPAPGGAARLTSVSITTALVSLVTIVSITAY